MRMSSVIGRREELRTLEVVVEGGARAPSALASPNCSMRRSGCAFCAAAVAASDGVDEVGVLVSSPGIRERDQRRAAVLGDLALVPAASGDLTSSVCRATSSRVTTSSTPAWNAGSVTVSSAVRAWTSTCSSDSSGKSARVIAASAARDSPLPVSSSASDLRADRAAEHERDHDERQPAYDRGLTVPRAPVSSTRGEVPAWARGPPRPGEHLDRGGCHVGPAPVSGAYRPLRLGSPTECTVGLAIARAGRSTAG